jgi:hypothetical protein
MALTMDVLLMMPTSFRRWLSFLFLREPKNRLRFALRRCAPLVIHFAPVIVQCSYYLMIGRRNEEGGRAWSLSQPLFLWLIQPCGNLKLSTIEVNVNLNWRKSSRSSPTPQPCLNFKFKLKPQQNTRN